MAISGISGTGFIVGVCIGAFFLLLGLYLCLQNRKADSKWSLREELMKSFKSGRKKDKDKKEKADEK